MIVVQTTQELEVGRDYPVGNDKVKFRYVGREGSEEDHKFARKSSDGIQIQILRMRPGSFGLDDEGVLHSASEYSSTYVYSHDIDNNGKEFQRLSIILEAPAK